MKPQRLMFVGRDLQARVRLQAAAASAGLEFASATSVPEDVDATIVILDLDSASQDLLDDVANHRPGDAAFLGYYSHVDQAIGEQAERAGVKALPRSAFWRDLDTLITGGSNSLSDHP